MKTHLPQYVYIYKSLDIKTKYPSYEYVVKVIKQCFNPRMHEGDKIFIRLKASEYTERWAYEFKIFTKWEIEAMRRREISCR